MQKKLSSFFLFLQIWQSVLVAEKATVIKFAYKSCEAVGFFFNGSAVCILVESGCGYFCSNPNVSTVIESECGYLGWIRMSEPPKPNAAILVWEETGTVH